MTPLQRTQEWMSQEQPSREDIQQTVDNLCNQLPIPPRDTTREELLVAISWLMSALGERWKTWCFLRRLSQSTRSWTMAFLESKQTYRKLKDKARKRR